MQPPTTDSAQQVHPRHARLTRHVGKTTMKWSLPVLHLLFVWALTLFDLHFFLAAMIAQPLAYMVHLGYPPLLLMTALQVPTLLVTAPRWVWHPPLLVILGIAAVTFPMAMDKNLAKISLQYFLIYYSISVATSLFIRSVHVAKPIIVMLFLQFAWYGAFARTQGLVPWHPTLANYDGFAVLMVQGAGLCYWFAVSAASKKLKLFLYALAGYCVLGVVASFARAAFLSLIVVVGWVWIRSPRKAVTAVGIVVAAVVVVAGASLIFDSGFFWNEMMSAFSEGTEEGTGAQRWQLWNAGVRVWMQQPIFGVGGGNFGAYASTHFKWGEIPGFENPSMFYGYNLHNAYMQLLAEFGIVGVLALGFALWDFYRRNRDLRTPEAERRWADGGGKPWSLRGLSLGLETANLANMLSAMFYATLFTPAFYTIWAANTMLWAITRTDTSAGAPTTRRSGRRMASTGRPTP